MILTDISLKRPVFATVTILALILLGLVSYKSLNIDEWPDVEFPFVTVTVVYKGAAPEQVDGKIIQKVEEAVSSVSGVKHIYSSAREGVGATTIEFTLETSPTQAAQDVRDKIGRIRGELPSDAEEPIIMRFDPAEAPIVSIAVTGNASIRELSTLVDDVIKRRLETVNGVGDIPIQGQTVRQIAIDLDRDKIAAYGLTIPDIVSNLQGENLEAPAGQLKQGNREVSVRTMGNILSAEQFLAAPVGRRDGMQLYVSHIGTARDTTEEATAITRFNGIPAIGLDIMKQSGANTVQVATDVKKAVAKLQSELPPGIQLTVVRDNSVQIRDSVNDVLYNLVLGGLLAVAIVFVFLGNWRSTMISAIAIPASIISTFFAMKVLGFTLNTMSLLALSLAVGILIDDAIVVIENIVRHMEIGKSKLVAAADATKEIGLAVTATTLTLVAVFIPVGMMTGIVGQFFKQFGLTVAFAVMVSLLIAFTLTPMMSAFYLDVAHGQKQNIIGRFIKWFDGRFSAFSTFYGRVLTLGLKRRYTVVAVALVLFFGSFALLPFVGSGFIGRTDTGEFSVWVELDAGLSIDGAAQMAEKLDGTIRSIPEVTMVYSVAKADKITTFVKLTDKNARKRSADQIISYLRAEMAGMPGVTASIVQKAGVKEGKPVELTIRGDSMDTIGEIAEQAQRAMQGTKGAVDVTSSYRPGKPDLQVVVKRDRAADVGVPTGIVADTLRTLFNGLVVSQFKDGDDRYDVMVRLKETNRSGISDLDGIYLPSRYDDANGKKVLAPLNQLADIVYSTTPNEIRRYDRQKEIRLTANLAGASLGDFNKELQKKLKQIELPPGYEMSIIGESERMNETFTSIGIALFLAVSFIFFVLAAQFESYIDPLAIMLALPLAIIGAIGGLFVMRSEMGIMALIGVIMLMGLVTKNAILLLDFAKQRMEQGEDCATALMEAAHVRLRPIMMTTAAMIFGMLPLAFGVGPGAEGRAPMAHAIIGGLVTSTLLTLVVVPVMYSLLNSAKNRIAARRNSRAI